MVTLSTRLHPKVSEQVRAPDDLRVAQPPRRTGTLQYPCAQTGLSLPTTDMGFRMFHTQQANRNACVEQKKVCTGAGCLLVHTGDVLLASCGGGLFGAP